MLPEEQQGGQELRVRAVYDSTGRLVGYQDPDANNIFILRDQGISRLHYDAEQGLITDSFDEAVAPFNLGFPSRGYSVNFKYKTARYKVWDAPPQDYNPQPGQALQVRIVIVDTDGVVHVIYRSFGEGQGWSQELEDKILGEGALNEQTGLFERYLMYPYATGFEVHKSYITMTVSLREVGP